MNPTHEVFNQPAPLVDVNLFSANRAMQAALKFNAPGLDTAPLHALGATVGSAEMQTLARLANVHTPQLKTHNRFGQRVDLVEFHPSYHALMTQAVAAGLHGAAWGSPHPPSTSSGQAKPLPQAGEGASQDLALQTGSSFPLPLAGEGRGEGLFTTAHLCASYRLLPATRPANHPQALCHQQCLAQSCLRLVRHRPHQAAPRRFAPCQWP